MTGDRRALENDKATRRVAGSNLVDDVSRRLRDEILSLRLAPGAPLPELELANRFGVSRTPVRESLQRLSAEGLVKMIPGRGAFVTELSIRDILELFQLREALETYSARLAARSNGREVLTSFVGRMEASRVQIEAERFDEYYDLCAETDRMIAEVAGNKRLQMALLDLWVQTGRARRLASTNAERLLPTVDEHIEILTTIIDGEEDAAAASVATHVRRSLHNILASSAGVTTAVEQGAAYG